MEKYSQGVQVYKKTVLIKEELYGENNESLLLSLKNLGQCHYMNKSESEAINVFERAISLGEKVIPTMTEKEPRRQAQMNLSEIMFTLFSLYDAAKSYQKAIDVIDKQHNLMKELHGEKST